MPRALSVSAHTVAIAPAAELVVRRPLVRTLTILIVLLAGCAMQRSPPTSSSAAGELLVFVGELQWLRPHVPKVEPGYELLDEAFLARYRVVEVLQGRHIDDFVEFEAYDHYGFPAFATKPTAVLYLSRGAEGFVHEKYQFDHVYKTSDGRWAGCGDPYVKAKVRPKPLQRLEFQPAVEFDVAQPQALETRRLFPRPIFEISGNRAVCKMGVYAEELMRIKLETVLRERGYRGG